MALTSFVLSRATSLLRSGCLGSADEGRGEAGLGVRGSGSVLRKLASDSNWLRVREGADSMAALDSCDTDLALTRRLGSSGLKGARGAGVADRIWLEVGAARPLAAKEVKLQRASPSAVCVLFACL